MTNKQIQHAVYIGGTAITLIARIVEVRQNRKALAHFMGVVDNRRREIAIQAKVDEMFAGIVTNYNQ